MNPALAGAGPAVIGLVILAEILSEDAITASPATTSTALVVAALLIALPAVLFVINPDRYRRAEARIKNETEAAFRRSADDDS